MFTAKIRNQKYQAAIHFEQLIWSWYSAIKVLFFLGNMLKNIKVDQEIVKCQGKPEVLCQHTRKLKIAKCLLQILKIYFLL